MSTLETVLVILIGVNYLWQIFEHRLTVQSFSRQREQWNDERRELLNRIQAPETTVWKSLASEMPTDKGMPDPPDTLSPALSSEAEEGEMHLVGKVVQGDFGKGKDNES